MTDVSRVRRHVPFLSVQARQARHARFDSSHCPPSNVNNRDFHLPRAAVIMAIRAAITISVTSFLLGMCPSKNLSGSTYSGSTQSPCCICKTGVLFTHWIADSLTLWKTPVTDAHLWVAARYYHVLTKGAAGVGYAVAAAAALGASTILWSLGDGEAGNLMFDGGSICEFSPYFFYHPFCYFHRPCLLNLTAPISPVQYRHCHLCAVSASQYVHCQWSSALSRRSLTPRVPAPFQAYSPTMSRSHPTTPVPSSHPTCARRRSDSHRAISSAASHLQVSSPCRQADGGPSVQMMMLTPRRSSARLVVATVRRKVANRDLRKLRRVRTQRG